MIIGENYKELLTLSDDKTLLELRQINEDLITKYESMISDSENTEDRHFISWLCGIWHNNATVHLPIIEAEIAKRQIK